MSDTPDPLLTLANRAYAKYFGGFGSKLPYLLRDRFYTMLIKGGKYRKFGEPFKLYHSHDLCEVSVTSYYYRIEVLFKFMTEEKTTRLGFSRAPLDEPLVIGLLGLPRHASAHYHVTASLNYTRIFFYGIHKRRRSFLELKITYDCSGGSTMRVKARQYSTYFRENVNFRDNSRGDYVHFLAEPGQQMKIVTRRYRIAQFAEST